MDTQTQTTNSSVHFADIPANQVPHPTLFRVAVTPARPRKKSAGGILIPEKAQDNEIIMQQVCKIVALGPAAFKGDLFKNDPVTAEKAVLGAIVVIGTYAGQRMEIINHGEDKADWPTNRVFFINDHDILTVIPNADDYKMFNG